MSLENSREEWLEWRKGGIGASDAPSIMGVSPWKSPYQFWRERYFNIETPTSTAMEHGKKHEDAALDWFESLMGVKVRRQVRVEDSQFSWMRATLDGITEDSSCMVEVKSPYDLRNHEKVVRNKKVPDIYFPQLQHQMRASGSEGMYFFSYNWKDPGASICLPVARDNEYIATLIEKEKAMWDCILSGTPPAMTEKDVVDMENNPLWEREVSLLNSIDAALEELQVKRKECKDNLIKLVGERSGRGSGFSLTHSMCKGSVDYQQAIKDYLNNLRSHYPEIDFPDVPVEPYRKKSFEKWSLRSI